jgi:hypothetical protein
MSISIATAPPGEQDPQKPPDRDSPTWGEGQGIKTYAELGLKQGTRDPDTPMVHVAPFLRWFAQQEERHGHPQALLDIRWEASGAHRIGRWRKGDGQCYAPVAEIEDALHYAGLRLAEVYPETDVGEVLTGWCPTCNEAVTVQADMICAWCDTPTQMSVEHVFHHATKGPIRYQLTPEQQQSSMRKRSRKIRYLTDEDLEVALTLYQVEKLSMRHVADRLWQEGRGHRHTSVVRVEEALRRAFRRHGYATRSTAESNAGVLCRGKLCAGRKSSGEPCGQSAKDGSRFCPGHDPDLEADRKRRAHLSSMRAKRAWVGKQLPMAPFVQWLWARKAELALPVAERRFVNRDESLSRLSKATGVDSSTLIKWMRYESSKGQPKQLITARTGRPRLTELGGQLEEFTLTDGVTCETVTVGFECRDDQTGLPSRQVLKARSEGDSPPYSGDPLAGISGDIAGVVLPQAPSGAVSVAVLPLVGKKVIARATVRLGNTVYGGAKYNDFIVGAGPLPGGGTLLLLRRVDVAGYPVVALSVKLPA